MDAKITKKRLGEFLSYEWIKIIAIAVAVILFWSTLFTMTSARLTVDQVFTVINYSGTTVGEDFTEYSSILTGKKVLSYEVNEVSVMDITANEGAMSGTLLDTRLTTGEGDVMYVADIEGDDLPQVVATDEDGNPIPAVDGQGNPVLDSQGNPTYQMKKNTYLQQFLTSRYYYTVMPLEDVTYSRGEETFTQKGVLTTVDEYLSLYFEKEGGVYASNIDREAVESDFRARVAETKDKRFRNESLIQSGIEQEIERLQKYREAYQSFLGHLDNQTVVPTLSKLVFSDGENTLVIKGAYSLNLCPNEQMKNLKEDVFYYQGEEGKEEKTATDINLIFLNLDGSRKEFVGEKLLFVNYLVNRYKAVETP